MKHSTMLKAIGLDMASIDCLDTLRLPRFEVPPDLPEPFDIWLENRVRG